MPRYLLFVFTLALAAAPALAQVSPGPLARAHAKFEGNANCTKCHAASKGAGMDVRCLDCHDVVRKLRADGRGFHARAGRDNCAHCHPEHAGADFGLIDFPKNGPQGFDHAAATGFALRGKHQTVRCAECHQPKNRTGAFAAGRWLGLSDSCTSCHEDKHKGALGPDCARCHNPSAWTDTTSFDHAKTDFPLTGKHTGLACAVCHRREGSQVTVLKPLPHAECSSCHTDAHGGRLGQKCAACHVATGFTVVAKSSFDHEKTRYPLRGAHRQVSCASCHDPKSPNGKRPPFASCGGCHADPHAGFATLKGARVDCAACHDVSGFAAATFGVARHAATPFPLEGKHAAVACAGCHRPGGTRDPRWGTAGILMRPKHETCASCHTDAHAGQFASRTGKGACEACHTTAGFAPSRYTAADHATLRVTLDGAHGRVACAACHGKATPVFTRLPTDCTGCHRDPHRFPDRSCTPCHTQAAFSPSTVGPAEHARYAFALDGAHAAVPCVGCHRELAAAGRRDSLLASPGPMRALTFRDGRRACADCHTGPHGTQFADRKDGGRCEACHGTDSIVPASRFDHAKDTKFALGAAHAALPCARCHVSRRDASGASMVVFHDVDPRCQSCHAPTPAKSKGSS